MLARQFHDFEQQLLGVQRACGVVGVDDDDTLGTRRDLGADVGHIGHPAIGLVTHIVHGCAAGQAGCSRPQWIVGRRQQHLVAVVQQGIGRQADQFRRAIAQIDIIQGHALDALLLRLMHHGLAGGEDAFAVRITGRVGQVADHVLLHFFGRIKAEHRQIADIELDDLLAVVLHLLRRIHDRPTDVVTDVC